MYFVKVGLLESLYPEVPASLLFFFYVVQLFILKLGLYFRIFNTLKIPMLQPFFKDIMLLIAQMNDFIF